MSDIETNLQNILTKVYGKDVRQSIHDAIHDCYEDGKAGATDLVARERISEIVTESTGLLRGYSVQTLKITLSDLAQSGDKYNYTGEITFSEDVKIIDVVAYSSGYGAGIPISYKYENKVLTATATVTFEFAAGINATIVYLQSEPISLSELVDIRVGEDGTVYNTAGDAVRGQINELKSQIAQLEAIPRAVKLAMDTLFQNMVFKNTDVYTDELGTFHAWAAAVNIVSISAVFAQTKNYYPSDSLNRLKDDLIVTASFDDGTTAVISDYTLSGTLAVGTSTITITSEGKTTTFNVTVSKGFYYSHNMGLLSAQDYVTYSAIGSGGTETLTDSDLVLNTNIQNTSLGNSILEYAFEEQTSQNAKISCRVKTVALYKSLSAASADYVCGFKVRLGDSNGRLNAGIVQRDNSSALSIVYLDENGTVSRVSTSYAINAYHTFEFELSNGNQIISIDGTEVVNVAMAVGADTNHNYVAQQAGTSSRNPNGVTTNIDWIEFYEVS